MNPFVQAFGFFHWIGISHYLNLLLVGFMVRSGLEILSAHPKLYWRDDCRPGSEWLRLSRKKMPTDRLWTGADEETSFSSLIALPGRSNLGMGRHWHFFCAIFWILNGCASTSFFSSAPAIGDGSCPASWGIFPEAVLATRGRISTSTRRPPATRTTRSNNSRMPASFS